MRLIELSVFKNAELVRTVHFKSGLNLIVNSVSAKGKTGNSVGKSTLSRLLDYIFLSSGEDIYTEAEFGKVIPDVCSFINDNFIYVELVFEGYDKLIHRVGRNLTTDQKQSIYYSEREPCEKGNYVALISKQIFGQNSEKPSVRVLSHKFIRNTHEKMQNTTRFQHSNTKPDVYDQLYLFLFGFSGLDLLKAKANFTNQIATKTKHLAAYRNPHRESALQRMIAPLKLDESELQNRIDDFNFTGSQESSVQELVGVQRIISKLTIDYSKAKSRLDYLERSIVNLRENASSVDGRELSNIYREAGVAISAPLKRSYEELIVFHNQIIANKINLLNKDANVARQVEAELKNQIDQYQKVESGIFKTISEPDTLKSIGQIYNDLSKIREQIAGVTILLDRIETAKSQIEELEKSKTKVINEISENTDVLDKNIEIFNKYFGDFSKHFYGERYIFDLEFDSEKEKCRFDIANISPNPTGGKKKGELSAFDLAYIEFVKQSGLKRPTFVVHDSIEDVDVNQIHEIFINPANKNI